MEKKTEIMVLAVVVVAVVLIVISVSYVVQNLHVNENFKPPARVTVVATFKMNISDRTLTVENVFVDNVNWSDVRIEGEGSVTLPVGTISIGDVIKNCTGHFEILWPPMYQGDIVSEWFFPVG